MVSGQMPGPWVVRRGPSPQPGTGGWEVLARVAPDTLVWESTCLGPVPGAPGEQPFIHVDRRVCPPHL